MTSALRTAEDHLLDAISTGTSDDPFAVLGRHETTLKGRPAVVIRTIQPTASSVELLAGGQTVPMERRRREGLFEATVPLEGVAVHDFEYRFRVHEGPHTRDVVDSYQFGHLLTEFDLHLLNEGTHYRAWEKLGA